MNLRLRHWSTTLAILLIAFSAVSTAFVFRGALSAASPILFMCLFIGASGIPAALGIGIIVNHQPISLRAKRNIIGIAILLLAIVAFGGMFWMVGEAGYNQTRPFEK